MRVLVIFWPFEVCTPSMRKIETGTDSANVFTTSITSEMEVHGMVISCVHVEEEELGVRRTVRAYGSQLS